MKLMRELITTTVVEAQTDLKKDWKAAILKKYPKAQFIDGDQTTDENIYAIVGTYVDKTDGGVVLESPNRRSAGYMGGGPYDHPYDDSDEMKVFRSTGDGMDYSAVKPLYVGSREECLNFMRQNWKKYKGKLDLMYDDGRLSSFVL